MFFTIYALSESVRLVPAWLEGREVIAVFEDPAATKPSHFMWLNWRDNQITYIRDYRYAPYIITDAELVLTAPQ
jgi:RNA polymerase sigma-70 factor (ECF subfamily)